VKKLEPHMKKYSAMTVINKIVPDVLEACSRRINQEKPYVMPLFLMFLMFSMQKNLYKKIRKNAAHNDSNNDNIVLLINILSGTSGTSGTLRFYQRFFIATIRNTIRNSQEHLQFFLFSLLLPRQGFVTYNGIQIKNNPSRGNTRCYYSN
jgi:hypothetical protein